MTNHHGKVTKIKIGQSATKRLFKMKAQRLSLWLKATGVRPEKVGENPLNGSALTYTSMKI